MPEWNWKTGAKAKACFNSGRKFEEKSDGTYVYNVDEGRMTNHYRHVVFPKAEDVKKCLAEGENLWFIVEQVSNSSNPGDPQGAVPEGGFRHTYFHVKPGTVFSATLSNAKGDGEDEEEEEEEEEEESDSDDDSSSSESSLDLDSIPSA